MVRSHSKILQGNGGQREEFEKLVRYWVGRRNFSLARKYLALGESRGESMALATITYYEGIMEGSVDKLQQRRRAMVLPRKEEQEGDRWKFSRAQRAKIVEYEIR